ncbi:SF1B family DNA helicase RecD2 [Schwartzia succinivorans]|jgi:exodeoxyribonuclease V alpha subunit|uniref:ATP-dependent RecD2 DNA helicase n=1 Tax=Schwartzia succinivorans DSM 10502 TaxID=1123243 RepID=A0A1M4SHU1_9FIRM|nr:ATP-dependent RecD-like DNA helicase [Schwartzia succinivorans]MBQ1917644.1 ATP-dependent RecD-like DNA helicase [Schwartzia sp. (in: firmicutes)]MBE6096711.1 ATP-dependent RecD-like DNA helicase [Schwartzia succinivorans]MBQ2047478.1 ATP-dependent RecD-like DNA helicase [Schwartzia sp. (in: firmicutes)]MBQ5414252.1 ATP-dependent RecD-like DNA helicase [Schwartzia sp. (in: firmicutes)]SHE31756.1 exodeoxyribonuclease V alpha subunit [Schwartzia succinivorans DSM 10502]
MEKLTGTVETIVFASDDGRFSVFRLRVDGQRGMAAATVNAEPPLVGQQVTLSGEWVRHPRFGEQFKAVSLTVAAPTSAEGIEKFLSSGAVEGVGPAVAHRLVEKFGQDTLDIIENAPHRLREIPGIGEKTAEKIHRSYQEKVELKDIMLWLEAHGVSGAYAARIYQQFGSFSLGVMQEDPYRLAQEVQGIGFTTADAIARSADVPADDPSRLLAGLDYTLSSVSSAGHCCVPAEFLIERAARLLEVPREAVSDAVRSALRMCRLYAERLGSETLIYPQQLYMAEKEVSDTLLYLKKAAAVFPVEDSSLLIDEWETTDRLDLADGQREAVAGALQYGIFVLTGGPGTGKTTVVRGMIAVLEKLGLTVLLGAPTGRAAKRLAESTGRRAMTVHRMLEAQGVSEDDGSMFAKDEDEPLEADVIILDEVSMMDILLMQHFLAAVPSGCHVILVGDVDQLPAVGPGAVLREILRSGVIPSVRLTEVFRQAEESIIVRNAHAINRGRMPECEPGTAFEFRETHSAEEASEVIVQLCADELAREGIDPMRDVQVLSPMHRQECGVDVLNKRLQEALNPKRPGRDERPAGWFTYRVGDKVMQIKNNYQKNVFNGDVGFITEITPELVTVRFGDELETDYEKSEMQELAPAYAVSVHKSQGSEYPVIILPLVPGHHIMLQRNLLYTAVTRAKERVVLVGSRAALRTAVENDRTRRRYTLLAERLAQVPEDAK